MLNIINKKPCVRFTLARKLETSIIYPVPSESCLETPSKVLYSLNGNSWDVPTK